MGFWAMLTVEPANNSARKETRIGYRFIQDQPLNSDWMPRLTLEYVVILARIARIGEKQCDRPGLRKSL